MPIRIPAGQTAQALDLLKAFLSVHIMPGAGAQKDAVVQHIAQMETSGKTLEVDARFETYPKTGETRLTIRYFLVDAAPEKLNG